MYLLRSTSECRCGCKANSSPKTIIHLRAGEQRGLFDACTRSSSMPLRAKGAPSVSNLETIPPIRNAGTHATTVDQYATSQIFGIVPHFRGANVDSIRSGFTTRFELQTFKIPPRIRAIPALFGTRIIQSECELCAYLCMTTSSRPTILRNACAMHNTMGLSGLSCRTMLPMSARCYLRILH